jgi:hypothetical protein
VHRGEELPLEVAAIVVVRAELRLERRNFKRVSGLDDNVLRELIRGSVEANWGM